MTPNRFDTLFDLLPVAFPILGASIAIGNSPAAGELLTIWLVRIAMLCYFASLFTRLAVRHSERHLQQARWWWTIGYLFFLLHLLTAFQFVHHWSHAHAFEVTAERTLKTIGTRYGEGIYVNYVFMFVWGVDVLWWWTGLKNYEHRPRWISWAIQSFMLFIVVNATIVFAITNIRWWGIAGTILLGAIILIRLSVTSTKPVS